MVYVVETTQPQHATPTTSTGQARPSRVSSLRRWVSDTVRGDAGTPPRASAPGSRSASTGSKPQPPKTYKTNSPQHSATGGYGGATSSSVPVVYKELPREPNYITGPASEQLVQQHLPTEPAEQQLVQQDLVQGAAPIDDQQPSLAEMVPVSLGSVTPMSVVSLSDAVVATQYNLATPRSRPQSLAPGQGTMDEDDEVQLQAALGEAVTASVHQLSQPNSIIQPATQQLELQDGKTPLSRPVPQSSIFNRVAQYLGNEVAQTTVSCVLATIAIASMGKAGAIGGRLVLGDFARTHYMSILSGVAEQTGAVLGGIGGASVGTSLISMTSRTALSNPPGASSGGSRIRDSSYRFNPLPNNTHRDQEILDLRRQLAQQAMNT